MNFFVSILGLHLLCSNKCYVGARLGLHFLHGVFGLRLERLRPFITLIDFILNHAYLVFLCVIVL